MGNGHLGSSGTVSRQSSNSVHSNWTRPPTRSVAAPIVGRSGTSRARTVGAFAPFWSPDSGKVGFFVQSTLQVVTVADGTVQAITTIDTPELLGGAATWMANGDILLSPVTTSSGAIVNSRGLYRLSTQTGRLDLVPSLSRPPQLAYLWPSAVPGSDRFTFLSWHRETFDMTGHTATLQPGNAVTDIGQAESQIVATMSGHLVFVRNGALLAQRFATNGRAAGQPMVLARDVSVELPTLGLFSASSDVVVYLTRAMVPAEMEMSVRDDNGTKQGVLGGRGIYSGLAASPDGTRVAVSRRDPRTGTRDIWIHDLSGKPPVRLTFDVHDDMAPEWSADGQTILFTSDRSGERDIYRKSSAGQQPETLVLSSPDSKSLNAWARDGKALIYDTGARGGRDSQGRVNLADLFTVFLGRTPLVRPLATSSAYEAGADISPDGSLVAYHSSEAGEVDVFVETFPDKAGRWQVTSGGGREPAWGAEGRELFYLSASDEICAVDVQRVRGGVRFGPARVLFKVDGLAYTTRRFAVIPNRRRFIVLTTKPRATPQQMTVLINWQSAH